MLRNIVFVHVKDSKVPFKEIYVGFDIDNMFYRRGSEFEAYEAGYYFGTIDPKNQPIMSFRYKTAFNKNEQHLVEQNEDNSYTCAFANVCFQIYHYLKNAKAEEGVLKAFKEFVLGLGVKSKDVMGKDFYEGWLSNKPQHTTKEYFKKGLTITQFKGEPHQLKEYKNFIH